MIAFDPDKHDIVAVDRGSGQHFHVPLPVLERIIESNNTPALPPEIERRVSLLEQQIEQLVAHVMQLDRDAQQLVTVAKALDARIDRISILEKAA